jgi:uncharacterized protein (TIGR03083 family)
MEMSEHLAALRREGDLLGATAAVTELDTPIPTCPDWRMRDLVRHIGDVHRWAAAHVAERRTEPIRTIEDVAGPLPDDGALLDWFAEGHARLLETLETADPAVECWSFLPAPSPLAFWARRQAHETAIHRADAQSASGAISAFDPAFASDGVDELLFGFFGRPGRGDGIEVPPRTLLLRATDAGADGGWLVRLTSEGMTTSRSNGEGDGDADCSVDASASDLYLLLWNRREAEGLDVTGDGSILTFWRDTAHITWGRPRG